MAVDQVHHLSQQQLGVYAFPFVGGVREQVADIPQRQATQQGVAQGVDGHIPV